MQAPVYDKAAVDVNYDCLINKALLNRDIGNVNTLSMILMIKLNANGQIFLDIPSLPKLTQETLATDGLYYHQAHKPAYAPKSDLEVVLKKDVGHAKNSFCRMFQMLLVYLLHNLEILMAFYLGLEIYGYTDGRLIPRISYCLL